MAQLITDGDPEAAAELALENPRFYNTALKNYITPWTNEEQAGTDAYPSDFVYDASRQYVMMNTTRTTRA